MQQFPRAHSDDVESINCHVTTNPYFIDHEEVTENETDGNSENAALGYLAEDVKTRGLEIPRDCITLTRVKLGRGQFGDVEQVVVRKPNEPEMLCAAKRARGTNNFVPQA